MLADKSSNPAAVAAADEAERALGGITPDTVAPIITSVSPGSSSTNGGVAVHITGQNSRSGTTVSFGTTPATNVVVNVNRQTIDCVTPPHAAGNVKVRVTNPNGKVAELAHAFTYVQAPAPVFSYCAPGQGPAYGGTLVGISGANFVPGCQVIFGAGLLPAIFQNANTIGFYTPGGVPGSNVGVGVRNPDGQTAGGCIFIYDT